MGWTREMMVEKYGNPKRCTCGGSVTVESEQGAVVKCYGCGRTGERGYTREAAVMMWNMEVSE